MSDLNLCEILKGHEGEIFYSPLYGNMTFVEIRKGYAYPLIFTLKGKDYYLTSDGKFNLDNAECLIFPSKNQRSWNKWAKEQKNKIPKTWYDLIQSDKVVECGAEISRIWGNKLYDSTKNNSAVEKSALALLKIHQLIEVGYGGNVKNRDRINFYIIQWSYECNRFIIRNFGPFLEDRGTPLCFHTKEQAIEFLSRPENIQLLKDYFMIND